MSPETRAFLDSVRSAEDPTPEDERRVLAAVRTAAAAGALAGAGALASNSSKLPVSSAVAGVKIGGLVLGLSAAAWLASTTLPADRATVVTSPAVSSSPSARKQAPLPLEPRLPEAVSSISPAARPPSSSRAPARAAPIASAPAGTPSLRDEIEFLAEVQAALARGDGAAALRQLDQHVTNDRRLLAERRAARVLALCSLGRTSEAVQAMEVFLREHPASVQRSAVERSCARVPR